MDSRESMINLLGMNDTLHREFDNSEESVTRTSRTHHFGLGHVSCMHY